MHRLRVFGTIPGVQESQLLAEIKAHPALAPNEGSRRRIVEHLALLDVEVDSVQIVEEASFELH